MPSFFEKLKSGASAAGNYALRGLQTAHEAGSGLGYLMGDTTDLEKIGLAEQRAPSTATPIEMEEHIGQNVAGPGGDTHRGGALSERGTVTPSHLKGQQPTYADRLANELNTRPIYEPYQGGAHKLQTIDHTADEQLRDAADKGEVSRIGHNLATLGQGAIDFLGDPLQNADPTHGAAGEASKAISMIGVAAKHSPEAAKGLRLAQTAANLERAKQVYSPDAFQAYETFAEAYPRLAAHIAPDRADNLARAFVDEGHEAVGAYNNLPWNTRVGSVSVSPELRGKQALDTMAHEFTHGARGLRRHNQGGMYETLGDPFATPELPFRTGDWKAEYNATRDAVGYDAHPEEAAANAVMANINKPRGTAAERRIAREGEFAGGEMARRKGLRDDRRFTEQLDAMEGLKSASGARLEQMPSSETVAARAGSDRLLSMMGLR